MTITREKLAQVAPVNPAKRTKYRELTDLPQSLQDERKALTDTLATINSNSVTRPSGGTGWNRLAAKHKFTHTAEALFKVSGSRDVLLNIDGQALNVDHVFAAICAKANSSSDAKLLSAYCSVLEDAARVLRNNIQVCAETRKHETDYVLFQAARDEARNALESYDERLAGYTDNELDSIQHNEEIAELQNQVAALTAKVQKQEG